jgi:hypothetical protein
VVSEYATRATAHGFNLSFFSSYMAGASWTYVMGNFAQQSLPLDDEVVLEIQLNGTSSTDTITVNFSHFLLMHGTYHLRSCLIDLDSRVQQIRTS